MIIFKDPKTDDEIISDSYDLIEVGDGAAYEVDCQMITIGGETFDTGANASAEEAEEGVDDGKVQVNNVVNSFRLQSVPLEKKDYLKLFKNYLKAVTEKLKSNGASAEEIKKFQTSVQNHAKNTILANFKDYEFFVGESMNFEEGLILLLNYRDDGVTPYFTIWKQGLTEMKV